MKTYSKWDEWENKVELNEYLRHRPYTSITLLKGPLLNKLSGECGVIGN